MKSTLPILQSWPDYIKPAGNRRSLARFMDAREEGRVAFLLGAGVDIALASDTGQKSPDWKALMRELASEAGLADKTGTPGPEDQSASKTENELHSEWPTEMALIYRWILGEKQFRQKLTEQFASFSGSSTGPFATAIGNLLATSNVIVTLNYSRSARNALRSMIRDEVQIIELDREDLPSFQLPPPVKNPSTIYFIHLHGRAESLSSPVLDAWGYNVVQNEDGNYRQILRDLFEKRHVLSLGVSWTDMPLRSEAAFVKRTKGFSDTEHVALKFASQTQLQEYTPPGRRIVWAKAMKASYNLTVQPVSDRQQVELVHLLGHRPPTFAKTDRILSLPALADFLEFHGDFESVAQHRCFGETSEERSLNLSRIHAKCLRYLTAGGDPLLVARIERHLRHHLWLYFQYMPAKRGQIAERSRNVLYQHLLSSVKESPNGVKSWPDDLILDFLFGIPEVIGSNKLFKNSSEFRPDIPLDWHQAFHDLDLPARRFRGMIARLNSCQLSTDRLEHVPWVWFRFSTPLSHEMCEVNESFVRQLIGCGCDSLAAKSVLDAADRAARLFKNQANSFEILSSVQARTVVELSTRAADLARAAGHRRREVKAHALQAMWSADARQGRLLILGDSLAQQAMHLERPLQDGLSMSLVACHLAAAAGRDQKPCSEEIEDLIVSAGFGRWNQASKQNIRGYWSDRAPSAATRTLNECMKWGEIAP